jgi:hypothetical protein
VNSRLREVLTAGFRLSLSHDQCRYLVRLHAGEDVTGEEFIWRTLIRRGLAAAAGAASEPEPALTRAGDLIVELIAEAGLTGYYSCPR